MKSKTFILRSLGQGFTLIELMITVAIIGVLASIALPSYNEYIQRTHRAHAKATLLQVAQWMERASTATGSYPANSAVPASLVAVEGGRYTVTVTSTNGTFALTATRKPGTGQANDKCGDFTLDQANNRGNTNLATGATVPDCWNR